MTSIHTRSDAFKADLRRAYRAEYERTPALKAEFLSAEDYAALRVAESSEMVARTAENLQAIDDDAARQRAIKAGRLRELH